MRNDPILLDYVIKINPSIYSHNSSYGFLLYLTAFFLPIF